jgi:hypothetical protein
MTENQYKDMVKEVDSLAQEWNSTWKEACEVMYKLRILLEI